MIRKNWHVHGKTYVVFDRPVTKLLAVDIDQRPPAPALLAVGVVGEVVGAHLPQAILEVVRPRPGIAGRYDDGRRRDEGFRLGSFLAPRACLVL